MVNKLKSFALRWKYEAIIFVLTMLPVFFNFNKLSYVHRMYVPYYLYDFSMGFNSRMWVGSLVKILTSHPTEEWIKGFATVMLILGVILTAIVLGKAVKNAAGENRFTMLVFVLFFISGSLTISIFSRFFAMLDIHMYIIALVSVAFSQNKYLRWFVPALCVAGVLVNFVFTISYFPVVILALLYNADKNEKKLWHIVLFILTVVSVLGVTAYTVFAASGNMAVTPEEAIRMMENKIGHSLTAEQNKYAELYLFGQNESASDLFGKPLSDMTPLEYVSNYFRYFVETDIGRAYDFLIQKEKGEVCRVEHDPCFDPARLLCLRRFVGHRRRERGDFHALSDRVFGLCADRGAGAQSGVFYFLGRGVPPGASPHADFSSPGDPYADPVRAAGDTRG